jgi:DNA-directed RNA polymerase specialized sigma24 family protein
MAENPSVSFWIDQLKAGDREAAQPLWNRYFQHLVRLAYQRLRTAPRAVSDEEDIALSAFNSFCRATEKGRFPVLNDRDDLWKLLVVITERKAANYLRDQGRLKRGAAARQQATHSEEPGFADVPGREPTPLFAVEMAEQCERLLDQLQDGTLSKIAIDKMEGFTNDEIAARHDLALRTVERKLGLIRRIWEQQLDSTEN